MSLNQKPKGYWTYDITLKELITCISKLNHFPSHKDLTKHKGGLHKAIIKHGGITKFRKLLGYELPPKINEYYTFDIILEKIKNAISKLGRFPESQELKQLYGYRFNLHVREYGGLLKIKKLLGYEKSYKDYKDYTDDEILNTLKDIISKLGHFPSCREISKLHTWRLNSAIQINGGAEKFRKLLGYAPFRKPDGYWNDETVLKELKDIINVHGYFPTQTELYQMNKSNMIHIMHKFGGIHKFKKLLGYPVSFYESHQAQLISYHSKRGKASERLVEKILIEWCKDNNCPEPDYNVKLAKGNVIEFVCNTGKRIGIDVTNTALGRNVHNKWKHKDYYKYLDELWIVVFSPKISDALYKSWNEQSPDNVKVMSIDTFLHELDYIPSEYTKIKIKDHIKCTFKTKDELKKKYDSDTVQVTFN